MTLRLFWYVLSLEIKKQFTYRLDFWVKFIGKLLTFIVLAYFLWSSLYAAQGVQEIQGLTLNQMLLYYFVVSFILIIVRGHQSLGYISSEIYEGSLSRYLIYPLSFLPFKLTGQLSQMLMTFLQLILGLSLLHFFWNTSFEPQLILACFGLCLIGTYLNFLLEALAEFVAFWVDETWSLCVFLRFFFIFLGGVMLPLSFFPETLQPLLRRLPFYLSLGLPTEVLLGRVSSQQVLELLPWIFLWGGLLTIFCRFVWRKGLKIYSGVGI